MFNENLTIRDSIIENPRIIDILEKKEINFYSKANREISEILSEDEINDELSNKAENSFEYEEMKKAISSDTRDLIRYIKANHHKKELESLNIMEDSMTRVLNAHYTDYENIPVIYVNFMEVKSFLNLHFVKEERVDFLSMLRRKAVNISELEKDHDQIILLLENLSSSTNNFTPPEDTCPTHIKLYELMADFTRSIHRHIFLENYILFPRFL